MHLPSIESVIVAYRSAPVAVQIVEKWRTLILDNKIPITSARPTKHRYYTIPSPFGKLSHSPFTLTFRLQNTEANIAIGDPLLKTSYTQICSPQRGAYGPRRPCVC